MRALRFILWMVIGLAFLAQVSSLFGQNVERLIHDVTEVADGSVEQARLEAERQTVGAGPVYRSFKKDERKSFSGEYNPPELPDDKKGRFVYGLALFSDDGCNVSIKGSQIHGRIGKGQHLPNIGESFHVLPAAIAPGQPIDITIDYSNTIYDEDSGGLPDIDGCTLFLYLIPIELAVDANRDGEIQFGQGSADRTEANKPFRFWCNDDNDGTGNGAEFLRGGADSADTEIRSKRDLEDFARLWLRIGALHKEIAAGTLRIGLKWRDGTSPAVKVYRAVEANGKTRYLTRNATAASQISGDYSTAKATVTGTTAVMLPTSIFANFSEQKPKSYFLFEGVSQGKGQLVVTLHTAGGTEIAEGPGVWLDLVSIRKMYRRVKATGIADNYPEPSETTSGTPPEPTMGWLEDPNGHPYNDAAPVSWQKTNEYIVFVHGWNMSYEWSHNFGETMFKRLWQRGFKGRYAFMRWPTMDDSFIVPYTYNASEYRAWKCGESLMQFMASLPSGYTKNLVSHSMGGIVCGSALQKGMSVDNYALCHAAVPAACYDDSSTLDQGWGYTTPHYDSDAGTRNLSYRYKLNSVSGNLINFYLPEDDALEKWELNNYTSGPFSLGAKPQRYNGGTTGYYYDPAALAGERLAINYQTVVGRLVTTPHEAMSYVAQSPTKTVGADGRTAGSIDDRVDLTGFGFRGVHSAEFTFTLQKTTSFYNELLRKFDIAFLP